ncbi:MAG: hypothetical protein Kow0067_16380 [Coriobacteriia bacterium]
MLRSQTQEYSSLRRALALTSLAALVSLLASAPLESEGLVSLARWARLLFYALWILVEIVWVIRVAVRKANWMESAMALILTIAYLILDFTWA